VIEKNESFGSGCLGKYRINTNTSAEGFLRLLCYSDDLHKEESSKFGLTPRKNGLKNMNNYNKVKMSAYKNNEQENQNIIIYRKSSENKPVVKYNTNTRKEKMLNNQIPLFDELFLSPYVQSILRIGDRPAPLPLIGNFLNSLGDFIVSHIAKQYDKRILMNKTEVKSVSICNDDQFRLFIEENDSNKILQPLTIKAKHLILSTGGKQNIKNTMYDYIKRIKGEENIFNSDTILQRNGYRILKNRIKEISKNLKNKKINVTILGASHSGFSSAWILLNDCILFSSLSSDFIENKHDVTVDNGHRTHESLNNKFTSN